MSKARNSSITRISEFIRSGKDFIPSELPANREVIQKGTLLKKQKNIHQNKYSKRDLARNLVSLIFAKRRKANVKFQQPAIIGEKSLYY